MIERFDKVVIFPQRGTVTGTRRSRWKYVAANGNVLATSSESYAKRVDAVKAASAVVGCDLTAAEPATVVVHKDRQSTMAWRIPTLADVKADRLVNA